jgi:single-strand DNA-binding protein
MQQFVGNLTKDATIKEVSGKKVITFTVAENRYGSDAMFIQCSLWGREKLHPHLKKGTLVRIDGYVTPDQYNDKLFLKITNVQDIALLGQPAGSKPSANGNGNGRQHAEPVEDAPF